MTTKPCLILYNPRYDVHEAFNEDGRLIMRRFRWSVMNQDLATKQYVPVHVNSRLGRSIHDKIHSPLTNRGDS